MENKLTIKKTITIHGIRQSDCLSTYVRFYPCINGLFVKYRDEVIPVSAQIMNREEKSYTTSILINNRSITMVEHVFSAIFGLGIDNLIVEFHSNEAPFFANSELVAKALSLNIIEIRNSKKEFFFLKNEVNLVGSDGQRCRITPCEDFVVEMEIDFKNIIGSQKFSYSFLKTDYLSEISYARSFLIFQIENKKNPWLDFKKHFGRLPKMMLVDPHQSPYITYTKDRFITPLVDPLEPVRHKLLDFIGDMIFLGNIPKAKFEIYKPGHSFNREIINLLVNSDKRDSYPQ